MNWVPKVGDVIWKLETDGKSGGHVTQKFLDSLRKNSQEDPPYQDYLLNIYRYDLFHSIRERLSRK